jgi:hypothetical protein
VSPALKPPARTAGGSNDAPIGASVSGPQAPIQKEIEIAGVTVSRGGGMTV